MKRLFLELYLAWSLLVFIVVMLTLSPFLTLPYIFGYKTGSKVSYFFMRWWAFSFTFPNGGIRYDVIGRENLPKEAFILAANHNSFLDTPALVWAIPRTMKPLGKAEMAKVPIFGWLYPFMAILVDRKSAKSRLESLKLMKKRLSEDISIMIFPEGHQNVGNVTLQPFYDGAFRIAIETGRPLVPAVVHNSRKLLPPKQRLQIRPGKITIEILPPIETSQLTTNDISQLKEKTFNLMLERLANA